MHDFGNVAFGAQLNYKFKVLNPYKSQFIMEQAQPTCGCVSVVKRPAGAMDPRQEDVLELNLDTRRAGIYGRTAIKTINVTMVSLPDPKTGKVYRAPCTLTLQCLIQTNIRYSNDKLLFGVVNQGQTPQASLTIEHTMNPGWQITEVVPNNHPVEVKFQQVRPQIPGSVAAYQVVATLKPEVPAGEIKYEVQFKTNDPATPVITVLMEGLIQAPLIASPNNVDLGKVKVGEVVTGVVVLRGPPNATFNVTKIDGLGDGFSMALPKKAMSVHPLRLEFVPNAAGKFTKTLTLFTDLPGNITTTVVVEGTGVK